MLASVATVATAIVSDQVRDWWRGGTGSGTVLAPAMSQHIFFAPPPLVNGAATGSSPLRHTWIPAHWEGRTWVPGHWS